MLHLLSYIVWYIIKHFFYEILSHFEHKNDVTIITKLHRTTPLRLVALYNGSRITVTSFLFKMQSDIGVHGKSVGSIMNCTKYIVPSRLFSNTLKVPFFEVFVCTFSNYLSPQVPIFKFLFIILGRKVFICLL